MNEQTMEPASSKGDLSGCLSGGEPLSVDLRKIKMVRYLKCQP